MDRTTGIIRQPSLGREALVAAAALLLAAALVAGGGLAWNAISDAEARDSATSAIASARQQLERDQSLGADAEELAPLARSLDQVAAQDRSARDADGHRSAARAAAVLEMEAAAIGRRQQSENEAIQSAAAELAASGQDDAALRESGRSILSGGRNDATVAVWTGARGLDRTMRALERYGSYLSAGDRQQLAVGVAGVSFYGRRMHEAMVSALPKKAITISITDQQLVAYENGKPVLKTLVTTGRPPDLATDVGPMKVIKKDSPWKMHSPWPKGSPNWYPDAMVQMVVWFTPTGEGLHDASWQSGPYGPGSQTGPDASHGCVHVPYDAVKYLFGWSEIGQPVIVFPGDGSPLDQQLAQRSVDDNGHPLSGPRGA
jgi:hypothetical protein